MAILSTVAGGRLLAASKQRPDEAADEADEIGQVEKLAKEAGLGPFRHAKSNHFLVVGDAPESFGREAMKRCEELGQAFLVHFRGRGFTVEYPAKRLTIIALKDQKSYATILGREPPKDVGGHYDLLTNRLVIFDFRPGQRDLEVRAQRVNLFTLVHETAHQLSYNTGILDRTGDMPVCISEGLATYVEMWQPGGKSPIGQVNWPRLEALRHAEDWIPIRDLLADDKAFEPATEQLAYAESWLLLHHLLKSSSWQPRIREYLARAHVAEDSAAFARIAEQTLGPLDRLDREIKSDGRTFLRR
jgi:hypothetical protein